MARQSIGEAPGSVSFAVGDIQQQLERCLAKGGFDSVTCFGAYDATVEAGSTDRLVVVAQVSQPGA